MLLKPGLYIVSTPIGNLEDITLRALNVLKSSDIILCEDTRISQKLLAKYNITARLEVYNDHSNDAGRHSIIDHIERGKIVSLISDAGTPLISDPGYKLVRLLKERNFHVDAIPGVSSVIAALTISGLPTDRFLFAGFVPKTAESKIKLLEQFSGVRATLIFFETAGRLRETLEIAKTVLGNRECAVVRELTKLHQESPFGTLDRLIDYYSTHPLKGEIVLLISGQEATIEPEDLRQKLIKAIESSLSKGLSAKDAAAEVYDKFSRYSTKKEVYDLVNRIKETWHH